MAPLVPVPAIAAAPRGIELPALAKFWASYMTQMHDCCTPLMLKNMLRVDMERALEINAELVAQSLITPAQAVGRKAIGSALQGQDNGQGVGQQMRRMLDRFTDEDERVSQEGGVVPQEGDLDG